MTVEGGGRIEARHLRIDAYSVDVDSAGVISLDAQGPIGGLGAGQDTAGAGHGGRGGLGNTGASTA